ncbi:hypothetical protein ACK6D9_20225 [Hoeflea sp. Naph1]|uniref:hypothetical protein n=1 Tax=Hoeflea sp. Naph1 TaxID=3388653 RepID=UPI00398FF8DE
MADFVAVIRKAVDNLPENTPENRTKVYGKARAAIRRQLEAINPQPADEVIARQLDKLDQAIEEVESEHIEALPADVDETDALMAELESMVEKSPVLTETETETAPEPEPEPEPKPAVAAGLATPAAAVPEPAVADTTIAPAAPETGSRPAELVGSAHDEAFGLAAKSVQSSRSARKQSASGGKGGVLALVVILVFGVAAFAGWAYKDTFVAMFGATSGDTPVAVEGSEPTTAPVATPAEPETAPAVETTEETPVAPAPETDSGAGEKFTQRLNADGTETDPGPAPGPAADDTVEGRSVAALTDDAPADDAVADATTADAAVAPEEAAATQAQPLGVAQKMILYEERLGAQSLEVKQGTVVWTLVNEKADAGPDEAVIRGEINNPDKGLSALLTIKRNTDPSLPASHIIEVVFAVPADFDGGSIDQLQRITFKQTEADQGTPLIAVPAKITQDFYMVALNDLDEARKTNDSLMRDRNWIDIPLVYANGRQALITLEKGASGTEVFNEALDAWARATPQN